MLQTKKLLVPFDLRKPGWNPSEFLIPYCHQDKCDLRGLKSGRAFQLGRVVYIGDAITPNDLFAKCVDTGVIIDDVELSLRLIHDYFVALQSLKIGNVARISSTDSLNTNPLNLELVAISPSSVSAK
jgi:hypothetical protein